MIDKLVTAIVITHNRRNLLEKAIDSVLNQTYKNIELIIVNDNSTDGTRGYLDNFKNVKNIRVINIVGKHSRGGGYARNVGIKNSKGTYIAFLDDDDRWTSDKIEKQVDFLNNHLEYGMVYCRRLDVDYSSHKKKLEPLNSTLSGDMSNACFENTICTSSSMMVRKSLLDSVGSFDENLHYWQDFELNIRIAHNTLIGFINEPLMIYSLGNNDKNKLTNKFTGWWEAINYIKTKHRKYFNSLPQKTLLAWKIMVYKDAARRCRQSHLYLQERHYRYKVWNLDKSVYNLIRLIINY